MLFNSYAFIFAFLPATLLGFFMIGRTSRRLAMSWLGLASLFFYGWWNPRYVPLLLFSIAFNYAAGLAIGRSRRDDSALSAKPVLAIGITGNLLLLGYFKYTNFLVSTLNQTIGTHFAFAHILLPLGISFFTFTQIAFLVDAYRGIACEYDPLDYLLFVTYFPHLIAGPVLHHKQMMPQFSRASTCRFNIQNFNLGLTLFSIGLFKKAVLADQLALMVGPVFDGAANGGGPKLVEAWIGTLAYAFQLYFDFSGYCDMAIGASKMLNVDLPLNFNSPYKSRSIIEFWQRWHMTLSAFLRDYLYIPLGGNRRGGVRRYINLLVTMLLGGLWHGASWTFVFWGAVHGLYLILNHGWRVVSRRLELPKVPGSGLFAGAITFLAVVVAWVPFRATGFDSCRRVLNGLIGLNGVSLASTFEPYPRTVEGLLQRFNAIFSGLGALGGATIDLSIILICFALVWLPPNSQNLVGLGPRQHTGGSHAPALWKPTVGFAFLAALMFFFAILTVGSNRDSEFLYFQF